MGLEFPNVIMDQLAWEKGKYAKEINDLEIMGIEYKDYVVSPVSGSTATVKVPILIVADDFGTNNSLVYSGVLAGLLSFEIEDPTIKKYAQVQTEKDQIEDLEETRDEEDLKEKAPEEVDMNQVA